MKDPWRYIFRASTANPAAGAGASRLAAMNAAARTVAAIEARHRGRPGGVAGLLLGDDGPTPADWRRLPEGDAHDPESHAQYYFHRHDGAPGDLGHFHTFLRAPGMPASVRPLVPDEATSWPGGRGSVSHLVALAVDRRGRPSHLFTTNRWVTGEALCAGDDVIAMLDRFRPAGAGPPADVDRWLRALVVLFRPQIEHLIRRRDAVLLAAVARQGPRALEARELEIASAMPIDVEEQARALAAIAAKPQDPAGGDA
ncbi:MAG: hypothetical protein TEF_12260 [Rhizobiales bacterium NRL2]|jgi:hypothetical protein|nr:MAG: hypothetical protein TEF_12260 [Rhizobiales bacterium NRL2]